MTSSATIRKIILDASDFWFAHSEPQEVIKDVEVKIKTGDGEKLLLDHHQHNK